MNTPNPGYGRLVELLWPNRNPGYWPDLETLYHAAILKITGQEEVLAKLTEQLFLAQADLGTARTQAKNWENTAERYRTDVAELKRLFDDLNSQEVGQVLGLPVGTDICRAILPEVRKLKVERDLAREDASRKLSAINLLNAELARLRPAVPKFRIGQVVAFAEFKPLQLVKIEAIRHMPKGIVYDYYGGSSFEGNLRALTPEEGGF